MSGFTVLLIVVVIGIGCGVYIWNDSKNNPNKTNQGKQITITRTRIIGSECQKSIASAILRSAVGTLIGYSVSGYFFEGAFVGQIFILIGGFIGAVTAKNKYTTIFQVVYSDDSQEVVMESNKSERFGELCEYLDK